MTAESRKKRGKNDQKDIMVDGELLDGGSPGAIVMHDCASGRRRDDDN